MAARPAAAGADADYAHNRLNGDTNAHAHLRASLLGPSVSIPLLGGHLALGTWQQVVLIDFDDRPRQRTVTVQVVDSFGNPVPGNKAVTVATTSSARF